MKNQLLVRAIFNIEPELGVKRIGTLAQVQQRLPSWVHALQYSGATEFWNTNSFSILLRLDLDERALFKYALSQVVPSEEEIRDALKQALNLPSDLDVEIRQQKRL